MYQLKNKSIAYDPRLLRINIDSLLLYLIKEHSASYGYSLIKDLEQRSQGFFRFKEGTVYPALRKLENEGLIKSEWRLSPKGKERRYYSITSQGIKALDTKIAMWRSFTDAMEFVFNPGGGR